MEITTTGRRAEIRPCSSTCDECISQYKRRTAYIFILISAVFAFSIVAQATDDRHIDEIRVVGVTPAPSSGLDADRIAANVQSVTNTTLEDQHSANLSEFLERNLASVFVNQAQNNPLQPDLQFRGFVASPLLGLPQGISVYQDGVRINEPFGDTVNWALLPQSAIASIDLIPGSNPLFGLNTLGGALSIRTKKGLTHPGSRAEISIGSFQRVTAGAETGGAIGDKLGYFATAAYFEEGGWRDFSPSEAGQFFGNLSYAGEVLAIDLSINFVNTELIGNGPAPIELLNIDREAIFTRPDITKNDLGMLNLRGTAQLSEKWSLDGNIYVRKSDVTTYNGDESEFEECTAPANQGFLCGPTNGGEELIKDASGNSIGADESLQGATVNRSTTEQDSVGGALQIVFNSRSLERDNQFIVGGSVDSSQINFLSSTELGALDGTRLAVPGGIFVADAFTNLAANVDHYSLYFTDTLSISDAVAVTISGRFNKSKVDLRDRLGTALNGNHHFNRFNPAAGITYKWSKALRFYASYSESNRIPTPVELTCADETDPCRLPNAFLADPPLLQVVGKSWEIGARGTIDDLKWHLGAFRTTNQNDIIFVSAGALTNQGFFSNVSETVRRGIEASLSGSAFEHLDWFLNYTYLNATFEQDIALSSANNPAAVDSEIFVRPGDRIPLIPDGLLKVGLNYTATDKLTFGAALLHNEGMFFRGDEGNDFDRIPGYAIVNLRTEYLFSERLSMFITFDNVFDQNYESFGLFGDPEEVLGDAFDDPRFLGPGAPRAAWIGVRIDL